MEYYGIDTHDKKSNYFGLAEDGEELGTAVFPTTEAGFRRHFEGIPACTIIIEAGANSHWIGALLKDLGHHVVVANPRRVRLIAENEEKDDQVDAEFLARLGRSDIKLLSPTHLRTSENLYGRAYLKIRATYVKARTMFINTARGLVKPFGVRLPSCDTEDFDTKIERADLPDEIKLLLKPLIEQIKTFSQKIQEYDRQVEVIGKGNPVIERFRAIPGVGPLISLAFMLHVDDPERFPNGGSLAKYFGLTPGRRYSAGKGYQTSITKAGDKQMRALMIQAAHGFLRCKQDSDLKQWAEALLERKGRKGPPKKKVLAALARKLVRLLHHLWITGEKYNPYHHTSKETVTC